jgi:hypothetical protein
LEGEGGRLSGVFGGKVNAFVTRSIVEVMVGMKIYGQVREVHRDEVEMEGGSWGSGSSSWKFRELLNSLSYLDMQLKEEEEEEEEKLEDSSEDLTKSSKNSVKVGRSSNLFSGFFISFRLKEHHIQDLFSFYRISKRFLT